MTKKEFKKRIKSLINKLYSSYFEYSCHLINSEFSDDIFKKYKRYISIHCKNYYLKEQEDRYRLRILLLKTFEQEILATWSEHVSK